MFDEQLIKSFSGLKTPFYYYDLDLLESTLDACRKASQQYGFHVHYALKANVNDPVLKFIKDKGFGADCVSGNEVRKAVEMGFDPNKIVFAGVGKSDDEMEYALKQDIFCFNVESLPELDVLNGLALKMNKVARIALRINPNVNAYTHHYITTGLEENKFGINNWELEEVLRKLPLLEGLSLEGLHFHIGSQISDLNVFKSLCIKVNEFVQWFASKNIHFSHVNVGGGLGVNYHYTDEQSTPDFESYFKLFHDFIETKPGCEIHFELGRALVAQCGTLLSRVLYVKSGIKTHFVIVDAGMTELLRPALYQAYHKIENLSKNGKYRRSDLIKYDVVGPICESSDCFGKAVELPETRRGDLIAIRTTGAYGEVMVSAYNLRDRVKAIYSNEITDLGSEIAD